MIGMLSVMESGPSTTAPDQSVKRQSMRRATYPVQHDDPDLSPRSSGPHAPHPPLQRPIAERAGEPDAIPPSERSFWPGDDRALRRTTTKWAERCRQRSLFSPLSRGEAGNADALHLLRALGPAFVHGGETAALARAARNWGGRLEAPVDAVGALACLRDVVLDDLPALAGTVHAVLDRALEHAVEGATIVLRTEARTDPLTGCGNRLALDEDLERAVRGANRTGLDVSVAVVDLDGLKAINDSRGHPAGDAALGSLVTTLRKSLRDADTIYRIGGDEFAVIAPFTDAAGAAAMLERAARDGGPAFGWGVASLAGVGEVAGADPHLLVVAADTDMYLRRRQTRSAAHGLARSVVRPHRRWGSRGDVRPAPRARHRGRAACRHERPAENSFVHPFPGLRARFESRDTDAGRALSPVRSADADCPGGAICLGLRRNAVDVEPARAGSPRRSLFCRGDARSGPFGPRGGRGRRFDRPPHRDRRREDPRSHHPRAGPLDDDNQRVRRRPVALGRRRGMGRTAVLLARHGRELRHPAVGGGLRGDRIGRAHAGEWKREQCAGRRCLSDRALCGREPGRTGSRRRLLTGGEGGVQLLSCSTAFGMTSSTRSTSASVVVQPRENRMAERASRDEKPIASRT